MNDYDFDGLGRCDSVNSLGIDVSTSGVKLIISKLQKLDSTIDAQDGGMYREDRTISQVWVKTEMTESELDDWLYEMSTPREIEVFGTYENAREW